MALVQATDASAAMRMVFCSVEFIDADLWGCGCN